MTKIERGYVEQGFELPAGWSWETVAAQRAVYAIGEIYVPLVSNGVCVAWGVPMRNGEFMTHGED